MDALVTPFRFSPDVVRDVVEPGRPGSYVLCNDIALPIKQMTATLPYTPYRFDPEVVREVVDAGLPGSYVLGDDEDGFVPKYTGRSGRCIRTRLASHNHLYAYDYFIFRYAQDEEEAFLQECESWHNLRQADVDIGNLIHPASPMGSGLVCPYCHFARHVVALLAA